MRVACRYEAVGDDESRARGDRLIAWLRSYGERRLNSRLMDERRTIPPYVALDFGNQGILGMQVEEKYGGLALRSREIFRVLEQSAALDLALGTWVLVCLFPGVRPLASFGSSALRNEWLPKLADGRVLAGFAQTEPGAGTNFAAISSRALAHPGGGWRLSGDKVWIGNASWAGVLTAMAQEFGPDGRRRGLCALAVPVDQTGVRLGRELLSMGMRGVVQGEVGFRDVDVPPEHLLGESGQGIEVSVDSMCWSRFAIASTCVGAMKRSVQLMHRFATRRSIATGRLVDHPVARVSLGQSVVETVLAEEILRCTAEVLDAGRGVSVEILSICKIVGSELLWNVADRLVQVLGSRGYDEANLAPQLLRDARVTRIFEGTTEALVAYVGSQSFVATSEVHTFLREELGAGAIADALDEAVVAMRARSGLSRPWQCALAGWAAIWAVLAATADAALARHSTIDRERTALFAHARFRAACRDAAGGAEAEKIIPTPSEVEDSVAAFSSAIGDVDQHLPGGREEIDPLLLREPSSS
jgi:alkylation response protein AidB-like acyl-CoA dehydrogenase